MNPETLKAMKELTLAVGPSNEEGWLISEELANQYGHRVGSFIAICSPENVSALIAEVERQAGAIAELNATVTFLSQATEHTIPLDELRRRLGIIK